MGVPLLPGPGFQPVLITSALRKVPSGSCWCVVPGQMAPFLGTKTSLLLSQVFPPALPNIFDRIQEFAWVSGEGAEA